MHKKTNGLLALLLLLSLTFFSCKDDAIVLPEEQEVKSPVLMINEGNFQWGNASLSAYEWASKNFVDQLYLAANGAPIGDVFQSMILHEGNYYLVLNNSGKIIELDSSNFRLKRTFSGFQSPRYLHPIGSERLLVTDLYSNKLSILNLNTSSIQKQLAFPGWSEKMLAYENEVWIGNRTNDKVYIYDIPSEKLVDSIPLAHQVNSMVLDRNNKLWVLCQGDAAKKIAGGLYRLNPLTKLIELELPFGPKDYPFHLNTNSNGDSLFFLNKHIYAMGIEQQDLPSVEFINIEGSTPYGLGIDPKTGQLYFSDAHDYVKPSTISIYSRAGDSLYDRFSGGVLCNGFLFPEKK